MSFWNARQMLDPISGNHSFQTASDSNRLFSAVLDNKGSINYSAFWSGKKVFNLMLTGSEFSLTRTRKKIVFSCHTSSTYVTQQGVQRTTVLDYKNVLLCFLRWTQLKRVMLTQGVGEVSGLGLGYIWSGHSISETTCLIHEEWAELISM